jgi:hypothetical protein
MVLGVDLANKGLRGKVVKRKKLNQAAAVTGTNSRGLAALVMTRRSNLDFQRAKVVRTKNRLSPRYVFRLASWVGVTSQMERNKLESSFRIGILSASQWLVISPRSRTATGDAFFHDDDAAGGWSSLELDVGSGEDPRSADGR